MKALLRILMLCGAIAIIGFMFFNTPKENEPLEGPNTNSNIIPQTKLKQEAAVGAMTRPQTGISTLIGKDTQTVLEQYGEPARKEPSSFGYQWWVYNDDVSTFFMVGVEKNVVKQVYIAGQNIDAFPFKVGQKRDEIYRMTIIDYEVAATVGDNIFIFSMSEEDMQTRLLVKFDGLYAQLYIDRETSELQGIRYTDSETLVLHQPYEMSYQGELVRRTPPSSFLQQEIDVASAKQLDDLLNVTRVHHDLPPLEMDNSLEEVARKHSEDMKVQNFLAHESPTYGDLKKRLQANNIEYSDANENLATAYFDAIEAMHGWTNSPEHRKVLLNDRFTRVGSGAFVDYYTQIYLEPASSQKMDSKEKDSEGQTNEEPVSEDSIEKTDQLSP
ncbi:CAP domain-containing protein [Lysinibacillus irui]|uniref:CAP domain-containing protein n=1 Tax=Lysinibacillus irui TaxID=2998077 RepID=A0AAJ5RMA7_9BACI|nr:MULTISPECIES: CAP domain-containing protein [Lysinibacillus]MEA0554311.1 CAP domain-containing protein [Lysinibacillus irui]MEA0974747.1 CAP domain-containing protein [Lysinibacillus irui]MEA1040901.1 CAP domain-containing protein [Lysinibacillus irui]WDV07665.1 CAP domain-containing protein [Lysinibacillus irui]